MNLCASGFPRSALRGNCKSGSYFSMNIERNKCHSVNSLIKLSTLHSVERRHVSLVSYPGKQFKCVI